MVTFLGFLAKSSLAGKALQIFGELIIKSPRTERFRALLATRSGLDLRGQI